MTPGAFARLVRREARGGAGRLLFFTLCLGVGVAAVVAVAGVAASLEQGIRGEARQLLAADLAIESRRPQPPDVAPVLARWPGVTRIEVDEMVTVVAAPPAAGSPAGTPGRSQLVELKAIEAGYPFYGRVATQPDRPLAELLAAPDAIVVAPDLLARLGVRPGGTVRLGGQDFRVAGEATGEPDRLTGAFSVGPRVFVSRAGLERSGLVRLGSRVERKLLLKLPDGTPPERAELLAGELRAALPEGYRVQSYRDAQPSLRDGLRRVESFLGLVALLSLLVGGVGVAQTVRAWLAGRLDAIAVLKCLGMRPREVFAVYLGGAVGLALLGSVVGAAAGLLLQRGVPALLGDLVPTRYVQLWQPGAALRGLGLGVGIAALFSLGPLATALRVPPARVLRRTAEPLPPHRAARVAAVLGVGLGIFLFAVVQAGSATRAAQFTGAVAASALVLAGAGWALARLAGRLPRLRLGVALRQGLAALARPGSGAIGAVVALGLGVLVVLALAIVQRALDRELATGIPPDAPTAFLVDIQPDEWRGVAEVLRSAGATRVESVPVVMARLRRIDGVDVESLAKRQRGEPAAAASGAPRESERGPRGGQGPQRDRDRGHERRWALTREQRLTYLERLPPDNEIVEGKLWSDPNAAEVSVERDFANDLGIHLGSTLEFDVQGVAIPMKVTSLRTVDWRTFGINFFLVVEPGVLEAAPQQRLAVARLPEGGEQRVQDLLAAKYPNVTLLRTREILDRIRTILGRLGLAVRVLGSFTIAAGLAILAGAVATQAVRRGREVALLKTLGMTRLGVAAALAVEHALVGLVAGVVGVAGGILVGAGAVERVLEMEFHPEPLLYGAFLAGCILLAALAGTLASQGALRRRPIDALRQEEG